MPGARGGPLEKALSVLAGLSEEEVKSTPGSAQSVGRLPTLYLCPSALLLALLRHHSGQPWSPGSERWGYLLNPLTVFAAGLGNENILPLRTLLLLGH